MRFPVVAKALFLAACLLSAADARAQDRRKTPKAVSDFVDLLAQCDERIAKRKAEIEGAHRTPLKSPDTVAALDMWKGVLPLQQTGAVFSALFEDSRRVLNDTRANLPQTDFQHKFVGPDLTAYVKEAMARWEKACDRYDEDLRDLEEADAEIARLASQLPADPGPDPPLEEERHRNASVRCRISVEQSTYHWMMKQALARPEWSFSGRDAASAGREWNADAILRPKRFRPDDGQIAQGTPGVVFERLVPPNLRGVFVPPVPDAAIETSWSGEAAVLAALKELRAAIERIDGWREEYLAKHGPRGGFVALRDAFTASGVYPGGACDGAALSPWSARFDGYTPSYVAVGTKLYWRERAALADSVHHLMRVGAVPQDGRMERLRAGIGELELRHRTFMQRVAELSAAQVDLVHARHLAIVAHRDLGRMLLKQVGEAMDEEERSGQSGGKPLPPTFWIQKEHDWVRIADVTRQRFSIERDVARAKDDVRVANFLLRWGVVPEDWAAKESKLLLLSQQIQRLLDPTDEPLFTSLASPPAPDENPPGERLQAIAELRRMVTTYDQKLAAAEAAYYDGDPDAEFRKILTDAKAYRLKAFGGWQFWTKSFPRDLWLAWRPVIVDAVKLLRDLVPAPDQDPAQYQAQLKAYLDGLGYFRESLADLDARASEARRGVRTVATLLTEAAIAKAKYEEMSYQQTMAYQPGSVKPSEDMQQTGFRLDREAAAASQELDRVLTGPPLTSLRTPKAPEVLRIVQTVTTQAFEPLRPETGERARFDWLLYVVCEGTKPPRVRGDAKVVSTDEDIGLTVLACEDEIQQIRGIAQTQTAAGKHSLEEQIVTAWDGARAEVGRRLENRGWLDPKRADAERTGILVGVRVAPGTLPGVKTCTVRGRSVLWAIERGLTTARMRFVREVEETDAASSATAKRFEATDLLYAGETFAAEVETDDQVRLQRISLSFGLNGQPIFVTPADAKAGASLTLPAACVTGSPRVFRTPRMRLVDPADELADPACPRREAGVVYIPGEPFGGLQCRLGDPTLLQAPAAVRVHFASDDHVWHDAVERAARLTFGDAKYREMLAAVGGLDPAQQRARVLDAQVGEVSNLILTQIVEDDAVAGPRRRPRPIEVAQTTKLKLGLHAAMILLREEFRPLLRETAAAAAKVDVEDPEWLARYKVLIAPHMHPGGMAIGQYRVKAPSFMHPREAKWLTAEIIRQYRANASVRGEPFDELVGPAEFSYGYETVRLMDAFDERSVFRQMFDLWIGTLGSSDRTHFETWRDGAVKEAFAEFKRAVPAALKRAEESYQTEMRALAGGELPKTYVTDLLEMTGRGFDAIGERVKSRLMQRAEGGGWRGDRVARAWVGSVGPVYEQVAAQREWSTADTHVVVAASALIPVAVPFAAARIVASIAVGLATAAHATFWEIPEHLERERWATFAFGAGEITGPDRYVMADHMRTSAWAIAVNLGACGLGIGADVFQAWGALTKAEAAAAAADFLKSLRDKDVTATLKGAATQEKAAFFAVAASAETRVAAALMRNQRTIAQTEESLRQLNAALAALQEGERQAQLVARIAAANDRLRQLVARHAFLRDLLQDLSPRVGEALQATNEALAAGKGRALTEIEIHDVLAAHEKCGRTIRDPALVAELTKTSEDLAKLVDRLEEVQKVAGNMTAAEAKALLKQYQQGLIASFHTPTVPADEFAKLAAEVQEKVRLYVRDGRMTPQDIQALADFYTSPYFKMDPARLSGAELERYRTAVSEITKGRVANVLRDASAKFGSAAASDVQAIERLEMSFRRPEAFAAFRGDPLPEFLSSEAFAALAGAERAKTVQDLAAARRDVVVVLNEDDVIVEALDRIARETNPQRTAGQAVQEARTGYREAVFRQRWNAIGSVEIGAAPEALTKMKFVSPASGRTWTFSKSLGKGGTSLVFEMEGAPGLLGKVVRHRAGEFASAERLATMRRFQEAADSAASPKEAELALQLLRRGFEDEPALVALIDEFTQLAAAGKGSRDMARKLLDQIAHRGKFLSSAAEKVADMIAGQRLLEARGLRTAKIVDVIVEDGQTIVIQERFAQDANHLLADNGAVYADASRTTFKPEFGEAVLDFMEKANAEGLLLGDFNPGNYGFAKEGDRWVVVVIDSEYVGAFGGPYTSQMSNRLNDFERYGQLWSLPGGAQISEEVFAEQCVKGFRDFAHIRSAQDFNTRMLFRKLLNTANPEPQLLRWTEKGRAKGLIDLDDPRILARAHRAFPDLDSWRPPGMRELPEVPPVPDVPKAPGASDVPPPPLPPRGH